jgi:uroporphyrinogen-III decarboxylase
MNSRELMRAAMRRQPTPRIPTMPQICHDVAVRIFAEEDGIDWIDGMKRCLEEPGAIYDYVIRLIETIDCDGLRLFVRPEPLRMQRSGDDLIALDPHSGQRVGKIDLHGGGHLVPDRPEPPIETLADAKERLDTLVAAFTDEKMEILRQARQRVPHRFVAGAPGGITLDIYTVLRGREQSYIDLVERPDFVHAVLDMQAEAIIQRAEKLLTTGIDVFYIGDPAASASLISPRHFEKFCMAPYRKFVNHFKERDILIYMHICGNSKPILEMMADTGVHVIEPLDPLGGVSVADAKQRVGQRVALMGGVNTITLSQGTPADVQAESIQKCREGGPFGYILAAGDMVPPDTSLANLQALVDVATRSLWK